MTRLSDRRQPPHLSLVNKCCGRAGFHASKCRNRPTPAPKAPRMPKPQPARVRLYGRWFPLQALERIDTLDGEARYHVTLRDGRRYENIEAHRIQGAT